MVQKNEEVTYQGKRGRVTAIMGDVPNQAVNIKFDDGGERLVMLSELNDPKPDNTLPKPERPHIDNTLPPKETKPVPTPYTNTNPDYVTGMSEVPIIDPPKPPLAGADTPNDSGPGTGDTGAGLKADGKDVDSPRRRLLGTEEIVTYIEPTTRKAVDKNGRSLEIGNTVSIKARLVKVLGDKVEVLYPPYVRQSGIPVWSSERNRLEWPNQDDPTKGSGAEYIDGIFSYKNGSVVDGSGAIAVQPELEEQTKVTIPTKYVERF